jgi:hypothetical protein
MQAAAFLMIFDICLGLGLVGLWHLQMTISGDNSSQGSSAQPPKEKITSKGDPKWILPQNSGLFPPRPSFRPRYSNYHSRSKSVAYNTCTVILIFVFQQHTQLSWVVILSFPQGVAYTHSCVIKARKGHKLLSLRLYIIVLDLAAVHVLHISNLLWWRTSCIQNRTYHLNPQWAKNGVT